MTIHFHPRLIAVLAILCSCGSGDPDSTSSAGSGGTSDGSTQGSGDSTGSGPATTADSTTTGSSGTGGTGSSSGGTGTGSSSGGDATGGSSSGGSSSGGSTGGLVGTSDCRFDLGSLSSVTGETPLGSFDGTHAWFGYGSFICPSVPRIVITETIAEFVPTMESGPHDTVVDSGLEIYVEDNNSTQWAGTRPALVRFRRNGQTVSTQGTVTITQGQEPFGVGGANYPTVIGSITVQGEGWSLAGDIEAPFCRNLVVLASCPSWG